MQGLEIDVETEDVVEAIENALTKYKDVFVDSEYSTVIADKSSDGWYVQIKG